MSTELGLLKHIPCPRGEACTAHRCLFRHAGDEEKWPLPGTLAQPAPAQHTGVARQGSVGPTVAAITIRDAAQRADASSHDGPRKRVKLGDSEYDPASPLLALDSSAADGIQESQKATAASAAPSNITTAGSATYSARKRPISPPPLPLKRKVAAEAPSAKASSSSSPGLARPSSLATQQGSGSGPSSGLGTAQVSSPSGTNNSKAVCPPASKAGSQATTTAATRKPEALNPRHLGKAPSAHEIRFKLLKMLHAEFSRLNNELRTKGSEEDKQQLTMSDQQLIWMALDMEEACAVTKPAIYSNTIKNRIMGYKRMTLPQWTKERADTRDKELRQAEKTDPSHPIPTKEDGGNKKAPEPVVLETGLTPQEEVVFLKTNLLTPISGLAKHGYVPVVPSEADIQKARDAAEVSKGWEVCDRCATRFQVFPGRREEDGALTSGGTCTYHPGKVYYPPKNPVGGGGGGASVKRYRCCGQAMGDSAGCATSPSHVFKTTDPKRLAMLWNFAETPANMDRDVPADRAVCFDCEMGYTAHGLELIRLTATAWPGGEELLDVLVRPIGEIIDLNSRYSGVWPEDITHALPFSAGTVFSHGPKQTDDDGTRRRLQMVSSPEVARDLLFSLIRPETPLIGHGLENDLNSMRIVHPTICDTILLYPHPKGLPVRYGLKMLVDRYLHRQIQVEPPEGSTGVLAGHDSAEDARAAGDLVRFKIKQDWATKKMDGWSIVDGQLVAPGGKTAGVLTEAFIEKDGKREQKA